MAAVAVCLLALGAPGAHAAPRVAILEPAFDFGTVEQGDLVQHAFNLESEGTAPLRLEHVKSSCGCVVTAAEGRDVPPGDSTWVSIELDTRGLGGPVTKTVTAYTNDPGWPAVELTVRGVVLTDVLLTPPVLYFGKVHRGQPQHREVGVSAGRPDTDFVVSEIEAGSPPITARLEGAAPGAQKIVVELAKNAPLGRFARTLRLHTTSPRQPEMTLEVLGSVEGDLAVLPSTVTFGVVRPDAGRMREVWIQNRGRRPVSVTLVDVPADVLHYELEQLHPGEEYVLRLWLRDDAPAGRLERKVQIFTDHPDESRLTVPVHAVVRARRG